MISALRQHGRGRAELGVALALLSIGIVVLRDMARIPQTAGQIGPVGPKAVPAIVGCLLIGIAVLLARDVLSGGRGEAEGGEDIDLSRPSDWRTVAALLGAFLANAVLIERIGWPLSGTILFFGATFALGSRSYVRDLGVSLLMAISSYYLFANGLGMPLPAGWLSRVM
jgi:putative tricarboxylic transport membrane protein